jgi:PPOX class probable F420-dependent enzyme
MAHHMSDQERRAFLGEGTRTAKLAVTRKNGAPHVAPIWFVLDGDDIIFTTGEDTVKGKAIRRDGRVALTVDDQAPPYSFVILEGTVTISRDPDDLLKWATKLAERYMGADKAEQYGRRNAVPEELLLRLTPTKTIAAAAISDED